MKPCPICAAVQNMEFTRKEGRALLICRDCRHIWWETSPTAEELAEYYKLYYTRDHDQAALQDEHRLYYSEHAANLFQLARRPASAIVVLDYGCSFPVFLEEAKKLGARRAIGVDYAMQITPGSGVEIVAPDHLDQVADGSVDILRFSHTLEHTVDPVDTLRKAAGKLRRGGLVYITQPNFPVFAYQGCEFELKDSVYPEHLHFFSPLSLAALATVCGLQIRQLFSHQNEEAVLRQGSGLLDEEYSKSRMAFYASKGHPAFPLGSYPRYAGENSVMYAFKPRTSWERLFR